VGMVGVLGLVAAVDGHRTVPAKMPMVSYGGAQQAVLHHLLGQTVWVPVHGAGDHEQVIIVDVGPAGPLEVARHGRATPGSPKMMDSHFGYYDLPAAARGYFGVTPARLSWDQTSMFAGLVQALTAYDPIDHLSTGRLRQRHVLDQLVATKVLSSAQAETAFAAPLGLR
jgi:Transglycosylase